MKNFLTFYRKVILITSMAAALCMLGVAHFVGYNGLIGSFLVNLSASAVTIALTVLFVDFLLVKERERQRKSFREIAELEIDAIRLGLYSIVAMLFRLYDIDLPTPDEGHYDPATPYMRAIREAIDVGTIKTDGFRLHERDIDLFSTEISRTIESLEKVIGIYSDALPESEREAVLGFYLSVRAIQSTLSAHHYLRKGKAAQAVKLASHKLIKYLTLEVLYPATSRLPSHSAETNS